MLFFFLILHFTEKLQRYYRLSIYPTPTALISNLLQECVTFVVVTDTELLTTSP